MQLLNRISSMRPVIRNSPSAYSLGYEHAGQYFIRSWEHKEFQAFCKAIEQGVVPKKERPVWVKSAYPRAYYYRAFMDAEAKDYQSAFENLQLGLNLEPDQPLLLSELAMIFGNRREFQKAVDGGQKVDHFGGGK